jgi:hypothetical protein
LFHRHHHHNNCCAPAPSCGCDAAPVYAAPSCGCGN